LSVEHVGVAKDFRRADRDQGFLLPPDLREWLPRGHLVWFVIDVVAALDLTAFRAKAKLGGRGREAFDPATLLALLVYAYAHGQRSSRQIERLCEVDVAFKVITGNEVPDHTTIARFRAAHEEAFADLFTQVLVLCRRQGLGRFGVIAIDGTKIGAAAAKSANRSEDALRREIETIIAEAIAVDAAEDAEFGDARGDELPEAMADPRTRKARLKQALTEIAAEQQAEVEATRVESRVEHWQQRVAAAEDRCAKATETAQRAWDTREERRSGPRAVPPQEHSHVQRAQQRVRWVRKQLTDAERRAQRPPTRRGSTVANVTDPQSRLLKSREGFVQGYNAQLAVTDDQLIAAVDLTSVSVDVNAFAPMMTAAVEVAKLLTHAGIDTEIGTVVADAGYFSETNLIADGPDRLIATGDRRATDAGVKATPTTGPPPPGLPPIEAMRHRMRDPEQLEIYRRRAVTVEPVNGMLKDRIGLRRFARRGRQAGLAELNLASAVHNLLKLHRTAPASG
jgi:transposase